MEADPIKIQVFKNFALKMDIFSFSEDLNVKDFLNWIAEVDRFS